MSESKKNIIEDELEDLIIEIFEILSQGYDKNGFQRRELRELQTKASADGLFKEVRRVICERD